MLNNTSRYAQRATRIELAPVVQIYLWSKPINLIARSNNIIHVVNVISYYYHMYYVFGITCIQQFSITFALKCLHTKNSYVFVCFLAHGFIWFSRRALCRIRLVNSHGFIIIYTRFRFNLSSNICLSHIDVSIHRCLCPPSHGYASLL